MRQEQAASQTAGSAKSESGREPGADTASAAEPWVAGVTAVPATVRDTVPAGERAAPQIATAVPARTIAMKARHSSEPGFTCTSPSARPPTGETTALRSGKTAAMSAIGRETAEMACTTRSTMTRHASSEAAAVTAWPAMWLGSGRGDGDRHGQCGRAEHAAKSREGCGLLQASHSVLVVRNGKAPHCCVQRMAGLHQRVTIWLPMPITTIAGRITQKTRHPIWSDVGQLNQR